MSEVAAAPHRFPIRVYYEDTDFSGVVYHANYLRYLERGRTEYLRALGISQSDLHGAAGGAAFAVRHMTLAFHAAARMDDELVVQTHLAALGGASVTMTQQILCEGTVLVEANVRIALVAGGRARRLPAHVLDRLRPAPQTPDGDDVTIS